MSIYIIYFTKSSITSLEIPKIASSFHMTIGLISFQTNCDVQKSSHMSNVSTENHRKQPCIVSNAANTSFCTVKLKHLSEVKASSTIISWYIKSIWSCCNLNDHSPCVQILEEQGLKVSSMHFTHRVPNYLAKIKSVRSHLSDRRCRSRQADGGRMAGSHTFAVASTSLRFALHGRHTETKIDSDQ